MKDTSGLLNQLEINILILLYSQLCLTKDELVTPLNLMK